MNNLEKMIEKGYIEIVSLQMVESNVYMFDVVKSDDMYLMYNGSMSGRNNIFVDSLVCLSMLNVH